jgi:hypothetical protein
MRKHCLFVGTLALVAICGPRATAQTPTVAAGRGEVYGFGGFYRGEGLTAGLGGGGAAYTAIRHLRVFGEGYYFRKNLAEALGIRTLEVKGSALAFEGGVHVLLPIGESRVVPFVSGGYGVARAKATAGRVSATDTAGHLLVGGGFDYYGGEHWGVRPEFRWYTGNEVRVTAAFFYRF